MCRSCIWMEPDILSSTQSLIGTLSGYCQHGRLIVIPMWIKGSQRYLLCGLTINREQLQYNLSLWWKNRKTNQGHWMEDDWYRFRWRFSVYSSWHPPPPHYLHIQHNFDSDDLKFLVYHHYVLHKKEICSDLYGCPSSLRFIEKLHITNCTVRNFMYIWFH